MNLYRKTLRPILFRCDPERVHDRAIRAAEFLGRVRPLRFCLGTRCRAGDRLGTTVAGMKLTSPIGLAAGFDKNGRAIPLLSHIGFGFVEIGSVSAQASQGNPRPRLFRVPEDRAIIVNYGVPNEGAAAVAARLERERSRRNSAVPLGINIVATNTGRPRMAPDILSDFLASVRTLAPLADYLSINVSCPNSDAEGDFFTRRDNLRDLVRRLDESAGATPVFLKVPASSKPEEIEPVVEECSEAPCIAGFMFNLLPGKPRPLQRSADELARMPGAVSGKPCEEYVNEAIAAWYARLDSGRHAIVAAGGIFSAEDAYRKIRLGASAVQIYTGMIYEGPGLIAQIHSGLADLLERDGFRTVNEAVGKG